MRVGHLVAIVSTLVVSAGCGRQSFGDGVAAGDPGTTSTPPGSTPTATPASTAVVTDTGFGTNGIATITISNATSVAARAAVDASRNSGDIVISGTVNPGTETDAAIAAFAQNGQVDAGFAVNGVATAKVAGATTGHANAVAPEGDMRLWVAGYFGSSSRHAALQLFAANGQLDTGFAIGGTLTLDAGYKSSDATAVVHDKNGYTWVGVNARTPNKTGAGGSIVYLNTETNVWTVFRLTPAGVLDTTFGKSGKSEILINGNFDQATLADLAVTPDGGAILVGTANNDLGILKLDAEGAVDANFLDNAMAIGFPGAKKIDAARGVIVDASGRYVVTADIEMSVTPGDHNVLVARVNADGTLDGSFATIGFLTSNLGSTSDRATRAVELANHDLVIGASSNGLGVLRLLANGVPDPNWGTYGWALNTASDPADQASDIVETANDVVVTGSSPSLANVIVLAAFKKTP